MRYIIKRWIHQCLACYPKVDSFELKAYIQRGDSLDLISQHAGQGSEWKEHLGICVQGFKSDSYISLQQEWRHVLSRQLCHYQFDEIIYETFRKHGECIQTRTQLQVHFSVKYQQKSQS